MTKANENFAVGDLLLRKYFAVSKTVYGRVVYSLCFVLAVKSPRIITVYEFAPDGGRKREFFLNFENFRKVDNCFYQTDCSQEIS